MEVRLDNAFEEREIREKVERRGREADVWMDALISGSTHSYQPYDAIVPEARRPEGDLLGSRLQFQVRDVRHRRSGAT